MLEKIPKIVGEALSGLKAGLEKTVFHADFAEAPDTVQLASAAFGDGAALPPRFTEDGAGTSPPLAWSGLPGGTAGVVLIAEDADSPTPQPLVHLLAWDLPPGAAGIGEGRLTASAEPAATLGRNSFMKDGWLPPDPPTGHGPHRYVFQVYALDRALDLPASSGRGALVAAMKGRVLAKGSLIGTYERT